MTHAARTASAYGPILSVMNGAGDVRAEFHPAWHELMEVSVGFGLTGGAWRDERTGAHVVRAAKRPTG
jgi:putative acyl-CoA dehydrogenase